MRAFPPGQCNPECIRVAWF